MSQFLLQIGGLAGTGKSTLAKEMVCQTHAVLLDKDVMMAAAMRLNIESKLASALAYEIGWELTEVQLRHGHSVILDNPASFTGIRTKGSTLARLLGVNYKLIECRLHDEDEHLRRLAGRKPLHSAHPTSFDGLNLEYSRAGTSPIVEPHLVIDTSQPFEACVSQALEYLRS